MHWCFLFVMLLVSPFSAFAQTTPLTVRVQDEATMQPVAGVVVTFTPVGGQPITATSDAQGIVVVALPAERLVVTLAAADGVILPWEAPYESGYPIQSVVGLTTFTVQIDPVTGVAHHALDQDWAGGPTQADDPTAALAPPATGTAIAAQTATAEVTQLPTSEVEPPTSEPTSIVPAASPTSLPSPIPTSSQPVLAMLPSSPPTPPATHSWTLWLPILVMVGVLLLALWSWRGRAGVLR
ncbi:Ig-like domain-containing protein [Herpetosiphon gulosus]|uniref:Big-1 domain-containing protein n=1 Tax=Herpetosiphon gulosus TaxID=1973496 RepID=A0ABP9X9K3_9CHLR